MLKFTSVCLLALTVFVAPSSFGGEVLSWGLNGEVPAQVTNVIAIAGAESFSVASLRDDGVAAWGLGGFVSPPAGLSDVIALASGYYHCLALKVDGTVIGWGSNQFGQINIPAGLSNVVGIAAGERHSLALTVDGRVVGWGSSSAANVPTNLSDVVMVAAGGIHSQALKADGTAVGWGPGSFLNPPPSATNLTMIGAQGNYALGLRRDGTVMAWGLSFFAGTNDFFRETSVRGTNAVAIAAGRYHALAIRSDRTVVAWGANSNQQTRVPEGLTNIVAVSCGASNSLSLRRDESILAFPNSATQTIYATKSTIIRIPVATGLPASYHWFRDGLPILTTFRPALILSNLTTSDSGTYLVVVSNALGSTSAIAGALDVLPVPTLAESLNATNLVWTTGGNAPWFPQVSESHDGIAAAQSGAITNRQLSFLQTEVTGPGTLTFWWRGPGFSTLGELRLRGPNTFLTYFSTNGLSHWQKVTNYVPAGSQALRWEFDKMFALGGQGNCWLDEISYVPGGTGAYITLHPTNQVALAGTNVTFTVRGSGTPPLRYQWYFEDSLIPGATNSSLVLTNVQIGSIGDYSAAVSNDYGSAMSAPASLDVLESPPIFPTQPSNQVVSLNFTITLRSTAIGSDPRTYQWRFNGIDIDGATNTELVVHQATYNSAGNYSVVVSNVHGRTVSSNILLSVVPVAVWGDGFWGQTNLKPQLDNVIAIAANGNYGLALKSDGTVVGWGHSPFGALNIPEGASNIISIAAGNVHAIALRENGTVSAWGSSSLGRTAIPEHLNDAVAIATKGTHNLALRSDGTIVGWGDNSYGQSASPEGLSNAVAIATGDAHSVALRSDGSLVVWGYNQNGETNVPLGLSNVIRIACGGNHTVALTRSGQAVAWGLNTVGQTDVPDEATNIVAIAVGAHHSLALRRDGRVVGWGRNLIFSEAVDVPEALTNVWVLAAGSAHSIALQSETPKPQSFRISIPRFSEGLFTLSVPTTSGRGYALEYSESLHASGWQTVALVAGNGSVRNMVTTVNDGPQRFYRIREW